MNIHRILQGVSVFIAGTATAWPHVPVEWQQHVPAWLLGGLAVATMVLPSPLIRDPKAKPMPTATVPGKDGA